MTQVFNKKFQVATCKHCGRITDISLSKDVRRMVVQNKTLSEQLRLNELTLKKIHLLKNGENQALHKLVAQLFLLLNKEQKETAYHLNKQMREELKYVKKQLR